MSEPVEEEEAVYEQLSPMVRHDGNEHSDDVVATDSTEVMNDAGEHAEEEPGSSRTSTSDTSHLSPSSPSQDLPDDEVPCSNCSNYRDNALRAFETANDLSKLQSLLSVTEVKYKELLKVNASSTSHLEDALDKITDLSQQKTQMKNELDAAVSESNRLKQLNKEYLNAAKLSDKHRQAADEWRAKHVTSQSVLLEKSEKYEALEAKYKVAVDTLKSTMSKYTEVTQKTSDLHVKLENKKDDSKTMKKHWRSVVQLIADISRKCSDQLPPDIRDRVDKLPIDELKQIANAEDIDDDDADAVLRQFNALSEDSLYDDHGSPRKTRGARGGRGSRGGRGGRAHEGGKNVVDESMHESLLARKLHRMDDEPIEAASESAARSVMGKKMESVRQQQERQKAGLKDHISKMKEEYCAAQSNPMASYQMCNPRPVIDKEALRVEVIENDEVEQEEDEMMEDGGAADEDAEDAEDTGKTQDISSAILFSPTKSPSPSKMIQHPKVVELPQERPEADVPRVSGPSKEQQRQENMVVMGLVLSDSEDSDDNEEDEKTKKESETVIVATSIHMGLSSRIRLATSSQSTLFAPSHVTALARPAEAGPSSSRILATSNPPGLFSDILAGAHQTGGNEQQPRENQERKSRAKSRKKQEQDEIEDNTSMEDIMDTSITECGLRRSSRSRSRASDVQEPTTLGHKTNPPRTPKTPAKKKRVESADRRAEEQKKEVKEKTPAATSRSVSTAARKKTDESEAEDLDLSMTTRSSRGRTPAKRSERLESPEAPQIRGDISRRTRSRSVARYEGNDTIYSTPIIEPKTPQKAPPKSPSRVSKSPARTPKSPARTPKTPSKNAKTPSKKSEQKKLELPKSGLSDASSDEEEQQSNRPSTSRGTTSKQAASRSLLATTIPAVAGRSSRAAATAAATAFNATMLRSQPVTAQAVPRMERLGAQPKGAGKESAARLRAEQHHHQDATVVKNDSSISSIVPSPAHSLTDAAAADADVINAAAGAVAVEQSPARPSSRGRGRPKKVQPAASAAAAPSFSSQHDDVAPFARNNKRTAMAAPRKPASASPTVALSPHRIVFDDDDTRGAKEAAAAAASVAASTAPTAPQTEAASSSTSSLAASLEEKRKAAMSGIAKAASSGRGGRVGKQARGGAGGSGKATTGANAGRSTVVTAAVGGSLMNAMNAQVARMSKNLSSGKQAMSGTSRHRPSPPPTSSAPVPDPSLALAPDSADTSDSRELTPPAPTPQPLPSSRVLPQHPRPLTTAAMAKRKVVVPPRIVRSDERPQKRRVSAMSAVEAVAIRAPEARVSSTPGASGAHSDISRLITTVSNVCRDLETVEKAMHHMNISKMPMHTIVSCITRALRELTQSNTWHVVQSNMMFVNKKTVKIEAVNRNTVIPKAERNLFELLMKIQESDEQRLSGLFDCFYDEYCRRTLLTMSPSNTTADVTRITRCLFFALFLSNRMHDEKIEEARRLFHQILQKKSSQAICQSLVYLLYHKDTAPFASEILRTELDDDDNGGRLISIHMNYKKDADTVRWAVDHFADEECKNLPTAAFRTPATLEMLNEWWQSDMEFVERARDNEQSVTHPFGGIKIDDFNRKLMARMCLLISPQLRIEGLDRVRMLAELDTPAIDAIDKVTATRIEDTGLSDCMFTDTSSVSRAFLDAGDARVVVLKLHIALAALTAFYNDHMYGNDQREALRIHLKNSAERVCAILARPACNENEADFSLSPAQPNNALVAGVNALERWIKAVQNLTKNDLKGTPVTSSAENSPVKKRAKRADSFLE